MRGPCACPCQVYVIRQEYQVLPTESLSNEDKHKAPTPPRIRPLSLQDEDNPLSPLLFCSVVKHHHHPHPYAQ